MGHETQVHGAQGNDGNEPLALGVSYDIAAVLLIRLGAQGWPY